MLIVFPLDLELFVPRLLLGVSGDCYSVELSSSLSPSSYTLWEMIISEHYCLSIDV